MPNAAGRAYNGVSSHHRTMNAPTASTCPAHAAHLAGKLARRMLQSLTRGESVIWMGNAADTFFWLAELHPGNTTYQRHVSGLRETIVDWLGTPANMNHYDYDAMMAALYTGSGV